MANSTYDILEFRCVIKDDWTELYIRISQPTDFFVPMGGWYKKIIPPTEQSLTALDKALRTSEYLKWDRGNPESN
jgi:hypothetical protein